MKFESYRNEIDVALPLLREAVSIARQVREEMKGNSIQKQDDSPVTVADFAIQAWICRGLRNAFPSDAVVAEESSAALLAPGGRSTLERIKKFFDEREAGISAEKICEWIDFGTAAPSRRFWVLDPVDGTKGFLRGGQYVVALGLIENGRVQIGFLGCPRLNVEGRESENGEGALVLAVRGKGAWIGPLDGKLPFRQLKVSSRAVMSEAVILRSVEAGHTNVGVMEQLFAVAGRPASELHLDSQAKYVLAAAGHADLFCYLLKKDKPDSRMKIWDVAPGAIIIEEAGGKITDLNGAPIDYTAGKSLLRNPGILVSNGRLHTPFLSAYGTLTVK
ncbi:MAG: hypothetical protein A2Z83_01455 [Omnitrophica bacterium GWA2_52_8]|nr:MAG: hypothetical protein A2Z83_01455 [Omnitrophica bacterium GWA2_52_8]